MIKIKGLAFLLLISSSVSAEYVDYSVVSTVSFHTNGTVRFSVSKDGEAVNCNDATDWHELKRCPVGDLVCENGLKRVAALLLSAKLARKEVSFEREGCEVTIVNLRD